MARKLTPKQERFVEEYIVDFNATRAARVAGYSEKNVDKIGWQLLGKARVSEAIEKQREKMSRKTGLSVEWWDKKALYLVTEAEETGDLKAMASGLKLCADRLRLFDAGAGSKKISIEFNERQLQVAAAMGLIENKEAKNGIIECESFVDKTDGGGLTEA